MTIAVCWDDAFGSQEEDKPFERRGIRCQPDGLEAFVGVLLIALVGVKDWLGLKSHLLGMTLCSLGENPSGKRKDSGKNMEAKRWGKKSVLPAFMFLPPSFCLLPIRVS